MTDLRDLAVAELAEGLADGGLTLAQVAGAFAPPPWPEAAMSRAATALQGAAPPLCGVPFTADLHGPVAENLELAGAIRLSGGAFGLQEDWDGAVFGGDAPLAYRASFGLLPRRPGPGLHRHLSQVTALTARSLRDLRLILQHASLRRPDDPDQVPLPMPSAELRRPCTVAVAVNPRLVDRLADRGWRVQQTDLPGHGFASVWAAGGGLEERDELRRYWAEIFRVFPLVVLPLSQAGLAAGLGVPALRLREMILIARWFADDRVLTAAEALG